MSAKSEFCFVVEHDKRSTYYSFAAYQHWLTQRNFRSIRRIQVNRDINWGGEFRLAPDLGGEA